jgi:hypothetical protein
MSEIILTPFGAIRFNEDSASVTLLCTETSSFSLQETQNIPVIKSPKNQ